MKLILTVVRFSCFDSYQRISLFENVYAKDGAEDSLKFDFYQKMVLKQVKV
jgi:hypothetical protein